MEHQNLLQHRAQEIYKNLKDRKSIVGKPQTAVLAACLFVACRLEHAPRTVNGIFWAQKFVHFMRILRGI